MLIISKKMGGYPDLNWELTVPHTVVLPIELYPPLVYKTYPYYVGVIRTLIGKYQKFMTCRLVYNILMFFYFKVAFFFTNTAD